MGDIELSTLIEPMIGNKNVIFKIDESHYLSYSVFEKGNVKKMGNVISIKTNEGNIINLNNSPDVVDKNYSVLTCIYQFISDEFKLKNIDGMNLGIQINGGITFIIGKLVSIRKERLSIVVRTVMNEILVLIHKDEELCSHNFSFMKNYL